MKSASLFCLVLSACTTDYEADATIGVKQYMTSELDVLVDTSTELEAAAPTPDADGWNATDDAADVEHMREIWVRIRVAYESIEGAIAVLFPQFDRSTDDRYDAFIELDPDDDPFDGEGATGTHSIERILWAGEHPPQVIAFESALPNYREARFPGDEDEARRFKEELVVRLVTDFDTMRTQFAPLALDPAAAFRGVIGSMQEQREKVTLAATGEDESRYSQATLSDMRANLEGGRVIYAEFSSWVRSEGGEGIDDRIHAGFDRIDAAYDAIEGDSLPPVPATWNPDDPDPRDLGTPYGQLFVLLSEEADPSNESSLVSDMNAAADLIGIPVLP